MTKRHAAAELLRARRDDEALDEEHEGFATDLSKQLTRHLESELEVSTARAVGVGREVDALRARVAQLASAYSSRENERHAEWK